MSRLSRLSRSSRTAASALALVCIATGIAQATGKHADTPVVGRQSDGSVLLPTGTRITPAGRQTELRGRPNAVAVRPGGRVAAVLVASADEAVQTFALATGRRLSASKGLGQSASYAGLVWSRDGRTLFASGADGDVAAIAVGRTGTLGATTRITLAPQQTGTNAFQNPYPGGLALSSDGKTLLVALSRDNALGLVDLTTRALTTRIPVGNAPHSVVVVGRTAYVTNEGGRPAEPTDTTNDSAGTRIVSDPTNGGSTTGTVSVVDLTTKSVTNTVKVGLHPTSLALTGSRLLVTNTNSDTLSVVDTRSQRVIETVPMTPFPGAPLGSGPDGVTVLPNGQAAVTLGLANATALVDLPTGRKHGRLAGLVPAAWYPADVAYDPTTRLMVVANLHGVGTTADADEHKRARGLGEVGSISVLPVPTSGQLRTMTRTVFADNHWPGSPQALLDAKAAAAAPARGPVPREIGGASPIKHVVYIIKENRTYDQLLGDIGRGNSDPSLAEFGKHVSPNTQALATQFPLFDNFYNSGRRSNDGHQWAVQAAAPDYLEKGVSTRRSNIFGLGRGTPPSSGFDALLYLKSGFLWENALRHGKTFENFGEYTVENMPPPAMSDVPSLQAHTVPEFSGFELTTPDVLRARLFANHLARYEAEGEMPNLITLTLPNDHTGGSNPLYPTPQTQVADNDQALGQIVEAISHSSFWSSTAIFVEEDDTQGGPDHVDGHRGPLLVISPYAKHGKFVDSTLYTQVSVVRTIEQILGLPPMNQLDAAAAPIRSAFTDKPDLTPYTALVPDVLRNGPVMNPPIASLTGLQRLWAVAAQGFDSKHLDAVNPALLNRDIWYSTHGWTVPYPGDATVLTPQQVMARFPFLEQDD
jgi:YVTN family beta-propeller protein